MADTNTTTFNDQNAGYWEWNMQGALPFDDLNLLKQLGYADNSLLSYPAWLGKIPESYVMLVTERLKQHIDSRGNIPFVQEVCFLQQNHSTAYYVFSGKVIRWNDAGQPERMLGSYYDITSHKETEKELCKVKDF